MGQLKMATLPQLSQLRYLAGKDEWPILQCRNIYVLPGVPQFFTSKIELVAAHLSSEIQKSEVYKVVLCVDETSIVEVLNTVVSQHPFVSFGSYPFFGHPDCKTVVTMEGKDAVTHEMEDTSNAYGIKRTKSYDEPIGLDVGLEVETPLNDVRLRSRSIGEIDDDDLSFTKDEMDLHVKLALEQLLR